ncbi:MAG: transposase [Candidatus Omnitrophota bacterium]
MPRIARNVISDIPYHVIHRGNNRQKIFFCDGDYRYFVSLIEEAKKKYECKLYSYVLMPNHIHFLLEVYQNPEHLAKYIKLIAQKYTQYINRTHKRTGTLWEGRFRSSLISRDNYLLACNRYIEMNPVRAKIVKDPKDYSWSSYRSKIGEGDGEALIDLDPLYMDLGKDTIARQKNYQNWFKATIPAEEWDLIRKAVNKGTFFGSSQFKEEIEKLLGRKLETRDKGRPRKA